MTSVRRLLGHEGQASQPGDGEVIEVELFVAVLGASSYTYAEATRTQQVSDFVSSVARSLTFFGGVPRAIVPDQLKSAAIKACRYDPAVQRTTAKLGRYYKTTIFPARPMSPRAKAKVEVGVQIAERWLLTRIRNETFASLGDLNRRLFELTEIINTRPMRAYNANRRELFERLDKPALGPLSVEPFQAGRGKRSHSTSTTMSSSSITCTRRRTRCSEKSFGLISSDSLALTAHTSACSLASPRPMFSCSTTLPSRYSLKTADAIS